VYPLRKNNLKYPGKGECLAFLQKILKNVWDATFMLKFTYWRNPIWMRIYNPCDGTQNFRDLDQVDSEKICSLFGNLFISTFILKLTVTLDCFLLSVKNLSDHSTQLHAHSSTTKLKRRVRSRRGRTSCWTETKKQIIGCGSFAFSKFTKIYKAFNK